MSFWMRLCDLFYASSELPFLQPPPFLHPDSTPPKRPWIFIGEQELSNIYLPCSDCRQITWFAQKLHAGTPGDEAAHIHIDNLGLPSWQVFKDNNCAFSIKSFYDPQSPYHPLCSSWNGQNIPDIKLCLMKTKPPGSNKRSENLVPSTSSWVFLIVPSDHADHPLSRWMVDGGWMVGRGWEVGGLHLVELSDHADHPLSGWMVDGGIGGWWMIVDGKLVVCISLSNPTMQTTLYPCWTRYYCWLGWENGDKNISNVRTFVGDLIIVNTRLWFHGTKVHQLIPKSSSFCRFSPFFQSTFHTTGIFFF